MQQQMNLHQAAQLSEDLLEKLRNNIRCYDLYIATKTKRVAINHGWALNAFFAKLKQ